MTEIKYLSVGAVNRYLKHRFDIDPNLNEIFVKGEISNFKQATNGYMYFTLKDEIAQISCVYFQNRLNVKIKDGMKILLKGKITVYEKTGSYQIYIEELKEEGLGDLYKAFLELKEKLLKLGYFDARHKKAIPKFPKTVGVITSGTGSVIEDIKKTMERRFKGTKIILYGTAVQGANAKFEIAKRIYQANQEKLADCLIIARGGGSLEDLWAFNEEIVAEAVFKSEIPIISAIGHETDITICDLVSDLRAPTPTAAAELSTPNIEEVILNLRQLKKRLEMLFIAKFNDCRMQLLLLGDSLEKNNPKEILNSHFFRVEAFFAKIKNLAERILSEKRNKLSYLENRLNLLNPENKLKNYYRSLEEFNKSLSRNYFLIIDYKQKKLRECFVKLENLNPLFILEKGFSVIMHNNKIIKSYEEVNLDDIIEIKLFEGKIKARVINIKGENEK